MSLLLCWGKSRQFPQVPSDDYGFFEHIDSRHQSVMWFGVAGAVVGDVDVD